MLQVNWENALEQHCGPVKKEALFDFKVDELVKSQKAPVIVIPVQTGIQENQLLMDSRFRGSDSLGDFLRDHQS